MKNEKGFTLIETLVYLALFAIILVGIAAMTYSIIEASGRSQTRTIMQEEGGFLLGKLNWALSGAQNISIVISPPKLTINKYNYGSNPLVFDYNAAGFKLRLKEGTGGIATDLNSDVVSVNNLVFTDIPLSGGKPEGVTVSFTLTSKTPNGATISQDFQTTKYLR